MSYWQIRFYVRHETVEALSDCLTELGAQAVTLENHSHEDCYDADTPVEPHWPRFKVTGLFGDTLKPDDIATSVRSEFESCRDYDILTVPEQDWELACLSGFRPTRISEGLWVCPSWLTPPDAGAVNIVLDPGLAFGTGTHATTTMCLQWLDQNRPVGCRVLDMGCGSGILAITALRLGAESACGVDIDPRAVNVSRENAEVNDVGDCYHACLPDDLPAGFGADLVVANILAGVLVDVSVNLKSLVRPDGTILLTGILNSQVNWVRGGYQPEFEFYEIQRDEWSMLVGKRRCTD